MSSCRLYQKTVAFAYVIRCCPLAAVGDIRNMKERNRTSENIWINVSNQILYWNILFLISNRNNDLNRICIHPKKISNTCFSLCACFLLAVTCDLLKGKILHLQVINIYSGISLRRTHHKADTLYKADKDFAPIL